MGLRSQSLRVTNVGYRLLRCTARVEPPGTRWVRLRPEHDGRPFQTIEQTELPIELELPETIDRPLAASIVIESNGGTRRIEVRIERPDEQVVIPEAGRRGFLRRFRSGENDLSRLSPGCTRGSGSPSPAAARSPCDSSLLVVNAVPIGHAAASLVEPRLSSFAIVLVACGVFGGAALASRRGERRDLPAAGFAGGALGLLAAALWFAVVQSVERVLGSWSTSIWAVALLWGAFGALFALVSIVRDPSPLGRAGGRAMSARWQTIGSTVT